MLTDVTATGVIVIDEDKQRFTTHDDVKTLLDASRDELALGNDYALGMLIKALSAAYDAECNFTETGVCTNI